MATESPSAVVEVTDRNFADAVLEESGRRPVVVDFWAAWCQPCRMIGPILERLAGEYAGRFVLGKLDVDANPQTSAAFRIQSIPAVIAFRDGRPVNEFIGAIPENSIRQFIETILPSEADDLAARAEAAERAGRTDEAEGLYRQAVALDAVAPDRLADRLRLHLTHLSERRQHGDHDVLRIHLEVAAERFARVRAPESVGAERAERLLNPPRDLVRDRLHRVAHRHHGAFLPP